ncbi:uncharacterized protein A4U43_C05F15610 [Asparagus officinalis]|uniref:TATA-binding protein-associated factor BTAF1 n=1 Tax=Asparagus officinalis TaxID=4686 RepID=A0A5P1ERU4_ASPOF|nr:uncharacterized protein A4U43_C05F15610 [Asparagus officinalis]
MAQQSSRLQRLLTLLDTGSTQATRFAAAQQIGDIAKSHPQDLSSLWEKVSQYLRSKNWDTRVAAARAIGSIAANIKHTSLNELFECIETELVECGLSDVSKGIRASCTNFHPNVTTGLSFRSFDINKVLDYGSPLLASGGQEYDVACDNIKNPTERLARQKQNISRRLGLDVCGQFMDVSEMIRDEDLLAQKFHLNVNGSNNVYYASRPGQNVQQLVANMVPNFRPKRLSARELNLLKRKAKVNAKDHTKCRSEDDKLDVQHPQNQVTSKATCSDPLGNKKDFVDAVEDEDSVEHEGNGKWPFRCFAEQLLHDMFDPVWEVRHGTIMALREILTHQGSCAGVLLPDLSSERPQFIDSDEKNFTDSTKRGRDIDLNVQFEANQHEPTSKRQKNCEESVLPANITYSLDLETNHTADVKFDGIPCNSSPTFVNGGLGTAHIKVESDVSTDGFSPRGKIEDVASLESFIEYESSISNINLPVDRPQSSKLIKLMTLARHSWIKNWNFLQDCAIRFLCILSLDRFGDYVSDQVVAPVRETCAQALGAVLKYMHPSLVHDTLKVLLQMQYRQEWEIRHGCLLGIKYLVAVRPELLQDLLVYVLPACKAGLEDPDDDVRAVAAEALIPTAASIVSLDDKMLHSIVMLLWDILLDLDDLSPSTSSVMNLLSEIYSQPAMVPKMLETLKSAEKEELDLNKVSHAEEYREEVKDLDNPYILSSLTPRLWPFMRHSIASVRHSAIRTLERLLEVGYRKSCFDSTAGRFWPASILGDALRIVFQNLLLESNDDIIQSSKRVWSLLLECPVQDLEVVAVSYFRSWLQLAATAYGSPLDTTKMFWPVALPRKSRFRAAAKMRAVKLESEYDRKFTSDPAQESVLQEKNFDVSTPCGKIIVGADSEKSVTHTRVATAEALGVFASRLPVGSLHVVIDPLWNDLISLSGVQRQVAAMVLVSWFKELRNADRSRDHENLLALLEHIRKWLLDLLACSDPAFPTKDSILPYAELSRTYAKMRNEANLLLQSAGSSGLFQPLISSININLDTLSIDDAVNFTSKLSIPSDSASSATLGTHFVDDVQALKERLLSTAGYLKCVQNNLHVTVSASVASSVVWMSELPAKLNPVILPLMAAVKREQEEVLQLKAAEALTDLIFHCVGRKPSPNDKLIRNLYRSRIEGFISRRGSELALEHLCKRFGSSLFDRLPKLWDCLTEIFKAVNPQDQPLTDDRTILEIGDSLNRKDPQALINNIQNSTQFKQDREAGCLLTFELVQGLSSELVPYARLLVVPLLKCMSDCDLAVRQSVTHSFAALVPLLPLARGLPPPIGLNDSLSRNTEDAQFLEQLLDNSSIADYKLPVDLKVSLRRYQQEGVNWLSFLRRFKLHGILCDDMGLGKTLQASAIVATDIVEQRACNNGKDPSSLIICPSTLVGHWAYEIEKFIDKSVIITLQYAGSVQERTSLQEQFDKCNVVITSYDVVRKDIDYLGRLTWKYCILDEGHIIKNPKSKITCAVKQLKAEHRLILSGTPIQNNVLELWSLFDFLMPGFLGTERQFQATYGKPLSTAKDSKCSAKDAEAGVMPFLLRRTKDEVLSDLPEKIIQDRYCDLSAVQLKLYEQFSSSNTKREISTLVKAHDTISTAVEATSSKATSHVFQALQYLLKLCSHPLLAIEVIPGCTDLLTELHGLHHSPKLVALQEILEECGIGLDASSFDGPLSVGQHRVLIFAQHRSLLDIIERDLFQAHMKSVTYLRLDGSVEQSRRFDIVKTFNSDPTIDVLLLTTNVGGLGLNLTSADTLVFMEHDWNPMKDLQAMDRAHRLGQRKVVNVHRLIMRGTLEEKVMSLQKFKVSVANAVINSENASLKTMNTDQLLDLFTPAPNTKLASSSNENPAEDSSIGVGGKAGSIIKGLGELWDQSQYDEEYNLKEFLAKLNS